MERESEYLLELLGAYLRREKPPEDPGIAWDKILDLSHIHGVTGVVSYMAYTHRLCADPGMHASMSSLCVSTVSRFGHRGALADLFLNQLQEQGIDHICMKGYVLRNYYPVPELRTFGDIDLVIRQEDREKCHAFVQSQGFEVKTDWEPVFTYHRQHEKYELHTQLLETDVSDRVDYRSSFRDLWAHVIQTGEHRFEFQPEYHFLYLLVHIAKHIHGSGAGIRMYMDIAAFIDRFRDTIDWEWISGELEKLELTAFAAVVLTAVERWFGIPSPARLAAVSGEVLDEFADYTLEAGVFGHHDREDAVSSMKNGVRESKAARLAFLIRRAFPPVKNLRNRYTYLQKFPWLLPAAWIHRFIITRGSLRTHTHEAEVILSAESDAIRRLHRIMKNIGL